MNVFIIAKQFDTYANQRLLKALAAKHHQVRFLSPLDCVLRIEKKAFDIISSASSFSKPDIALLRCIGYSDHGTIVGRALETCLGMHLKLQGTVCVNDPEAKFRASSKFLALQMLSHAGLPVPSTFLTGNPEYLEWIARDHLGLPFMMKMNEGTWGMGVELAHDTEAAHTILQKAEERNRIMLCQKFIHDSFEQDIRVFVIGGNVVAAMRRISRTGDFRSNIHQGGRAESLDLPAAYADIALSAASVLGLEIAGIDIVETPDGPLVLEANPSPGLECIEATTQIDIATQIVEYLESLNMT